MQRISRIPRCTNPLLRLYRTLPLLPSKKKTNWSEVISILLCFPLDRAGKDYWIRRKKINENSKNRFINIDCVYWRMKLLLGAQESIVQSHNTCFNLHLVKQSKGNNFICARKCTNSSKIPFTPKCGRLCEDNFFKLLTVFLICGGSGLT